MKLFLMIALAALVLSACGGGGSLPVVQPTPVPLTVSPASLTVTLGTPETVTISGGAPPYSIKNDCPTNGDSVSLSGTTITVTVLTAYVVTCPIQVTDSKGDTITTQVTLNY